ncbi:MAG: hypothetical protein K2H22_08425 [Muribaculaceae bacterium]|nr:hypothetical protein [Muribaculaceae bacterium]
MRRFLINSDYLGILTEEALDQLIRGRESRLVEAEEAAEQSIVEYLTENYEIEEALEVGKMLMDYNPAITYPAGAHFKFNDTICRTTRPINGFKEPANLEYWMEIVQCVPDIDEIPYYTQRGSYSPGDRVKFNRRIFECLEYNGLEYDDIRVPGVQAWVKVEDVLPWEANVEYNLWQVVEFNGHFYTLIEIPEIKEKPAPEPGEPEEPEGGGEDDVEEPYSRTETLSASDSEKLEDFEILGWARNPEIGEHWGMIDDYHRECNEYRHEPNEYVVYKGEVYYPIMNPVADEVKLNYNIVPHDPRNANIKKHMLRLAVYELFKLITPTNMSQTRIIDYETSITWLRDASRLKLTPGIPRKLDKHNKPVAKFATATFMRSYNPYLNSWQI